MSAPGARVLFVPASGPHGSGEYYRCLALARALVRRRDDVVVEFLVHRAARVERDARFGYHEIDATPTRAGEAVAARIAGTRPDLVVFDNAGRLTQLRAAKRSGARVVWISNRPNKRLKAFRPHHMRVTDLHVILDPRARLRLHERLLRRLAPGPAIELAGAIVAEPRAAALAPWRECLPAAGDYAVFVAGGGGYRIGERAVPEIFLEAAECFRRDSDLPTVVVMGPQYQGQAAAGAGVVVIRALSTEALGALLGEARLAVIGAGNMLSAQAMAAGVPCVVTAVGGRDQPRRVAGLQRSGCALAARLEPSEMAARALELFRDPARARAIGERFHRRLDPGATARVAERLLALVGSG